MSAFRFELLGVHEGVRRGRFHTPHGSFETPCFAPIGTYGALRGLTPLQVRETGAELILAKQRSGCTVTIPVRWDATGARFDELAP